MKTPRIHPTVFVGNGAVVVGDVTIGEESSIWYCSVLRGDLASIKIGSRTNIQDGTVIHVDRDAPTIIGNNVTVGHRAVLHGCEIKDGALIGMGAIVLNKAVIEEGALIGAGAVVTPGTIVPAKHLALGMPAKIIKQLDDKDLLGVKLAKDYVELAKLYRCDK